ncbi:hypothetical protein EYF80_042960 [Liparis tanakae]|uniref:Uncharacterized protein n=1 Tax=Liparis tanakae TaxID=230148 RepID=A0A4Z2G0X4_9TELE|nr:hypothetical protein EYF80_042960 [Liparis tanakae]
MEVFMLHPHPCYPSASAGSSSSRNNKTSSGTDMLTSSPIGVHSNHSSPSASLTQTRWLDAAAGMSGRSRTDVDDPVSFRQGAVESLAATSRSSGSAA